MSNFVPEKVFFRGVFLHYIIMKKILAESHLNFVEVYGERACCLTNVLKGPGWSNKFKYLYIIFIFIVIAQTMPLLTTICIGQCSSFEMESTNCQKNEKML